MLVAFWHRLSSKLSLECVCARRDCCEGEREVYVQMCLENIEKGVTVAHTLQLLITVLQALGGSSKKRTVKLETFIKQLNDRMALVPLLIHDLSRYKQVKKYVL